MKVTIMIALWIAGTTCLGLSIFNDVYWGEFLLMSFTFYTVGLAYTVEKIKEIY